MSIGIVVFAVLIQFLIAAGAASVAESRGRSYWLYAVFCFVLPGIALIMVPYLLIFTRRLAPEDRSPRRKLSVPVTDVASEAVPVDRVSELERLARLRDDGTLSADEFAAEKSRVLARAD
jgi:hypothetical protein